ARSSRVTAIAATFCTGRAGAGADPGSMKEDATSITRMRGPGSTLTTPAARPGQHRARGGRWPVASPPAGCAALLPIRYGHGVEIRRGAAQRALAGLLVPPRRAGGEDAMEPAARAADRPASRLCSCAGVAGRPWVAGSVRAPDAGTRGDGGQRRVRHAG